MSVLLAANAGVRRPGNEANRNDLVGENQIVPMFDLGSCHPQILTFDLLWSNPSFTIYCWYPSLQHTTEFKRAISPMDSYSSVSV